MNVRRITLSGGEMTLSGLRVYRVRFVKFSLDSKLRREYEYCYTVQQISSITTAGDFSSRQIQTPVQQTLNTLATPLPVKDADIDSPSPHAFMSLKESITEVE